MFRQLRADVRTYRALFGWCWPIVPYTVLRARRLLAYKVGLDWGIPVLGYLIDHDRDRHARHERELRERELRGGASWG